jgi:uncharacterized membrane protein YkvA (DUF1232 family)
MTQDSLEKRFVARMRTLLVSLPYDLKVLFEVISDENLPLEARRIAAGGAIYCLSPSDPIPDSLGIVGYADDVVLLRFVLDRFLALAGEEGASYSDRFPEQFGLLREDLELFSSFLGETLDWLRRRVEQGLLKLRYKGKDAVAYVSDEEASEYLYEEGLEFVTQYDIDEEAAAKLQTGAAVRDVFERRMIEESKRID